jgi:glycosyltransferase involved in cell wall biosynthesis
MHIALLSANPAQANPYIALLMGGLTDAGLDVSLHTDPGDGGLPAEVITADLLHLHWLELWGRPAYLSFAGWTRLGIAGRGLRRWAEPSANSRLVFEQRRRRFLDRFFGSLATYKANGGRLVYTVHNLGQHEGEAGWAEAEGLRRLLQQVDAVHVHAEYLKPELEARLPPLRPAPVVTIPHGNYVTWYPNEVSRQAARERLEAGKAGVIYLFLGMIRPFKGLEELVPAFRQLADPRAMLWIAGQSRPPDYARTVAQLAAADGRIRWHPQFVPDDQLQNWMNAADVVVLPYRHTTTSGASMLAFSFGKPIIAPALPAFRELMAGRPFLGELYDPASADGLRLALERARDVDWQACRQAILEWAGQFDWQTIGRRFSDLYGQVLGRREE